MKELIFLGLVMFDYVLLVVWVENLFPKFIEKRKEVKI